MSNSVVYVVKLLGEQAAATSHVFGVYARRLGPPHGEPDSILEQAKIEDEVEAEVKRILAHWGRPTAAYAAAYIDNDSVGGSTIYELDKLLAPLAMFDSQVLATQHYYIWGLAENERFDPAALGRLKRRAAIKNQPSERQLLFHLLEASLTWRVALVKSLTIIISMTRGPTWRDETILAANNLLPRKEDE